MREIGNGDDLKSGEMMKICCGSELTSLMCGLEYQLFDFGIEWKGLDLVVLPVLRRDQRPLHRYWAVVGEVAM